MDEENNSIYIFTVYFSSGKTLSAKFNGKKKKEILNSLKKGWNETTSIGEEFGINFSLVTHYEIKLTYKG